MWIESYLDADYARSRKLGDPPQVNTYVGGSY